MRKFEWLKNALQKQKSCFSKWRKEARLIRREDIVSGKAYSTLKKVGRGIKSKSRQRTKLASKIFAERSIIMQTTILNVVQYYQRRESYSSSLFAVCRCFYYFIHQSEINKTRGIFRACIKRLLFKWFIINLADGPSCYYGNREKDLTNFLLEMIANEQGH